MRFLSGLFVFFVAILASAFPAFAQQPRFVPHDINPQSEYPACAVLDVNRDGRLDIVSGGFWYEAPSWKKHFLREVEVIRGRFDDYSNLEVDVNADGWTDIISVNYRSQSLFWMENPGEKLKADPETPWTKHMIDRPGPMETGRLYDINADGKLDILPNGTTFAGWYELLHERDAAGTALGNTVTPRFVKHDLPKEIAGHGVGFGDINGDGRGDIVGPRGWLEAPEDRVGGRWLWHPEWNLTKDASIPILVHDVDSDGDADLIWGRGHRYGLYWLEQGGSLNGREGVAPNREGEAPAEPSNPKSQIPNPKSHTTWTWRAIDTSWAQPHSIFLADLNGDKQLELVAGKRYLGHEGKDPGEYDYLCAYSYTFMPATRTWKRHEILRQSNHLLNRAAFGLDPKCADIDGDGDLDIVAADRSNLVLLENLGNNAFYVSPSSPFEYNHQQPLTVKTSFGEWEAKTPFDYAVRRNDIQRGMQDVMGELPSSSRRVPLNVKIESREETPEYVRIKLTYAAEPDDMPVPALLLVPKSVTLDASGIGGTSAKKLPAMLCLHPTNPDGKAQTAGLVGQPTRHYGHQLAQRGYVCLIPDYPSFGDYKNYDFHKQTGYDYASGSMKAIWNNIRAVDLLESLGYVDIDNIGTIGHSLGGHNALFTAVFEPRLKAVVTSCGFTAFHDYYKGDLKGWTSDRYMPAIRDRLGNDPDKVPFDFHEVLAAIAPRGIYVAAPLHDANFDNAGVRKCIAAAQPVFDLLGAKDQLITDYPDCAHDFPDDVRERVYQWLDKLLK